MPTRPSIPRAALLLGWFGVVPFAACAIASVIETPVPKDVALSALILYGSVILSFMGGAQWGLAMAAQGAGGAGLAKRLAISVLPALVGFGAGFLPPQFALAALAAGFVALLAYDVATARSGGVPLWYPALRVQLTSAVVGCLAFAAIAGHA